MATYFLSNYKDMQYPSRLEDYSVTEDLGM